MNEKLQAAIEWLGKRWIHHPQSTFDATRWKVRTAVSLSGIRQAAIEAGRL